MTDIVMTKQGVEEKLRQQTIWAFTKGYIASWSLMVEILTENDIGDAMKALPNVIATEIKSDIGIELTYQEFNRIDSIVYDTLISMLENMQEQDDTSSSIG